MYVTASYECINRSACRVFKNCMYVTASYVCINSMYSTVLVVYSHTLHTCAVLSPPQTAAQPNDRQAHMSEEEEEIEQVANLYAASARRAET